MAYDKSCQKIILLYGIIIAGFRIVTSFSFSSPYTETSVALSHKLRLLNITTGFQISRNLYSLKDEGLVKKWDITLLEPKPISKKDLFITTRTAFSTNDYMGDIIKGTQKKSPDFSVVATTLGVTILSSIIIPQLPISSFIQNILSVITIFAPFSMLLIIILFPNVQNIINKKLSSETISNQKERIIYHEAGHFLAGYLCGLPILAYDTSGDTDAGTTIDFSILNTKPNSAPLMGRTGHLLVVAMAGVVAETLRFGDSSGGLEDFPVAYEVLRISKIPSKDREDTLRWGILKALNLLRIYRDELDLVADSMRDGKSLNMFQARQKLPQSSENYRTRLQISFPDSLDF
eukprot:gene4028-8019_t